MRLRNLVVTLLVTVGLAGSAHAGHGGLQTKTLNPDDARASGVHWLAQHQAKDGGWGAGVWGQDVRDVTSDVATTSLVIMALLRDANGTAKHDDAIDRGVIFVVRSVESSPLEGPRLQGPEGTQPQHKLGGNVDTHFAALMLGEAIPHLSDETRQRADIAYDKVLTKVVAAQQADGSFDGQGWAPVLSSSVAAQSLYRARDLGKEILPEALARSDEYQRKLVDPDTGRFDASEGAGVDLYAAASSLRGNSDAAKRAEGEDKGRSLAAARLSAEAVRNDSGALMAGFGSVGGEEMLSYMMISDTMAEQGGEDWKRWEKRIGGHLVATQNGDGSWSGHHCITSTTFVTAAAVMTLASGDANAAQTAQHGVAGDQAVAELR